MSAVSLYEQDFHRWCLDQADAARFRELVELRNRPVHAYAPESDRETAISNAVHGSIPELLDPAAPFARFTRTERLVPEAKGAAVAEALERLATAADAR